MTRTGTPQQRTESGVLSIKPFRRLWTALSLAGLGDWLSILALTALAVTYQTGEPEFSAHLYAVAAVFAARLVPTAVFGPVGDTLARRADGRTTMLAADMVRFVLMLSVPLVGTLAWLLVAAFLLGCSALVWNSAKDASIPMLVPADQVARARAVNTRTWYGMAPVAAVLFALLALLSEALFDTAELVFYVTAALFLISGLVSFLQGEPATVAVEPDRSRRGRGGGAPVVRALTIGVCAVFAAAASVIAIAKVHTAALGGGDAAYGMVFAALSIGLACGMFLGPRVLLEFSRRRLFALAIVTTGLVLAVIALVPNLVVVVMLTAVLGAAAGVAASLGHRLAGDLVEPEQRGRAQDFVRSLVAVTVPAMLVLAPVPAALIGPHEFAVAGGDYRFDGTQAVLLIVAVLVVLIGLVAYRGLDDRRGVPLVRELAGVLSGVPYAPPEPERERTPGLFIAFEGGEGAGKTTQARLAAIWLRDQGYDVVTTNEPGATKTGMRLRAILLDKETTGLSSRAETLLYAADRADHVSNVIVPALQRGAIVVTDRYVDSSLAYQGYGRDLPVDEIAEVNAWATDRLRPDLTILLDVPPEVGLNRFASPADRIESEPQEFHQRVRRGFRELAAAASDDYLVVEADRPQPEITRLIQDRIREMLPDPVPADTEDATSSFPAITDF